MLKLAIKLGIAALIANAVWQAGSVYAVHIQFRDEVRQAALVRGITDAQLQQRVKEIAALHDIPLEAETLAISRDQRHVFVKGAYEKRLPLAPRFEYPWRLEWEVDAYLVEPAAQ
jgi:hypothetical protein